MNATDGSDFCETRMEELLRAAGVPDSDEAHQLVNEIWSARDGAAPPETLALDGAARFGATAHDAGDAIETVVRRVIALGNAIGGAARTAGVVDDATGARLVAVAAEASARAAAGFERLGHDRREAWLSFLCHDLKNPLNTILNALWLIREHRAAGSSERFVDLAERAVRRMEGGIKDLRDLHQKERSTPRSKADVALPPQPPR